ncbi:MAG: translesion error-prone DNA polymerase V autoproteolytic subunit [Kiritimatiellae bacterium]|nr:translesion error-prone DNA polymerase V autoproteolytic subunit [Kiritimatiellia bacterium]
MPAKAKVSGSVVAGFPSPAEQYQEPPLDLNELLVKRPAATFFVRVQGSSMTGAGINDGDLLVVDRSLRPASGDVIIACVDGDFTVKTYRRDKDGVRLEPANPDFPVIRIKPGQELDYFGKVTASIHRF